MPRPITATIDLAALTHNLGVARAHAPHARVFAVIKANAYGHGLLRAAEALRAADGFAVIEFDAALRLSWHFEVQGAMSLAIEWSEVSAG